MIGIKTATLGLWISFTCIMGFGMFVMKNQVQSLEKELVRINANISEDIKAIHVLKAEWSHLNSPARLRELAGKHIDLNPMKAGQIIRYASLPFDNQISPNDKRAIAQKNIGTYADRNRNLKLMASMD